MNYEVDKIEDLESSMEHWILSDSNNALETFGEDVVAAVSLELGHDSL